MLVLGIMSGTSLDGVDYALCAVSARGIRLVERWRTEFPRALALRLHGAARGEALSHELAQLHHDLGRFYAEGARRKGSRAPALAGLHGQTVFHHPDRRAPATLQIGEPSYLAEVLGVPVVHNFRAADMAAGGQGAPLATLFHVEVFARRGRHVCVNNLGGISNVTSIDWRAGSRPVVLAFDTGPANVLLDLAARHFSQGKLVMDRGGVWALRGRSHEGLVQSWLRHPFIKRRPPKSTGREVFGEAFLARVLAEAHAQGLSSFDVMTCLTEFTAAAVAVNYARHLGSVPDEVVLTGGGAANAAMVEALRRRLAAVNSSLSLSRSPEHGWPLEAVEPAAFALLAWRRMQGLPGNLPATTGARRACLLGQVTAGRTAAFRSPREIAV